MRTVAIVGSFRRHYDEVVAVARIFTAAGILVASPAISRIVNPGEEYVRFESDPHDLTDQRIQAITMARILAADLVYVVAPGGYIGRTTSYELGRAHERGAPVYYSEPPNDLPIEIGPGEIVPVERLPEWLLHNRLVRR